MLSIRHTCILIIALSALLIACTRIPLAADSQQSGAFLVIEVDAAALQSQTLDNVADRMAEALRDAQPIIRYSSRGVHGDAARIQLTDPADLERARQALAPLAHLGTEGAALSYDTSPDGRIEARLTPSYFTALSHEAVVQSMEVIRRRIDASGAHGVSLSREGDLRIRVRAPRVIDSGQLRRIVGTTGHLSFHLVREVTPTEATAGRLPPGTMLVQPYPGIGETSEVVEQRPRLTGERLVRANPSMDSQTRQFVLAFGLDQEGTRIFCQITRNNTGQRFAILLDNQVLTAPTINEPICGGSGQISGNFTAETANDLAVTLRAGALPTRIIIVEEGVAPPN